MNANSAKLLIRADAGPSVGTGHVMRMMALGHACRKVNVDVTFVCGELPRGLVTRLEKSGIGVVKIANANCDFADARDTTEVALALEPDWIVLDGYRFDDDYQARIRRSNSRLMVIDDYGHADHAAADLILNQNIYAKPASYGQKVRAAELLLGCRYALLRSEFTVDTPVSEPEPEENEVVDPVVERFVGQKGSRRSTRQTARRILVTMGGCDEDNWTEKIVDALACLNMERLIVDVVVGAGYRHQLSLLEAKRRVNYQIRVHRNVDRISVLMKQVDLAITAGGSTCYELANCGVPAIAIPVADNQVAVVDELARRGSLVVADQARDLANQIKRIINNGEGRRKMSLVGKRLVDGLGATRIARHLVASLVHFRSASIDDAKQILAWRNDPEVRSVSFSESAISVEQHEQWLRKKLTDRDCDIWIAEDQAGEAIGQVRLDYDNQMTSATISVVLDHTRRARGMGTVLIDKATRLAFFNEPTLERIVAQIKPGNVASERAFSKTGFRPIAPTTIHDQLALQYVLNRPQEMSAEQPLKRSA